MWFLTRWFLFIRLWTNCLLLVWCVCVFLCRCCHCCHYCHCCRFWFFVVVIVIASSAVVMIVGHSVEQLRFEGLNCDKLHRFRVVCAAWPQNRDATHNTNNNNTAIRTEHCQKSLLFRYNAFALICHLSISLIRTQSILIASKPSQLNVRYSVHGTAKSDWHYERKFIIFYRYYYYYYLASFFLVAALPMYFGWHLCMCFFVILRRGSYNAGKATEQQLKREAM